MEVWQISNKEQIIQLSGNQRTGFTTAQTDPVVFLTRNLKDIFSIWKCYETTSINSQETNRQSCIEMASNVTIESTNEIGSFPGVFWDKGTNCGLVVVHEWWGLTDTIKKQATLIANRCNISVLAPDLFRGWMSTDMSEASPHFAAFDWEAAMLDIAAAVNFLKAKGCQKVFGISLEN